MKRKLGLALIALLLLFAAGALAYALELGTTVYYDVVYDDGQGYVQHIQWVRTLTYIDDEIFVVESSFDQYPVYYLTFAFDVYPMTIYEWTDTRSVDDLRLLARHIVYDLMGETRSGTTTYTYDWFPAWPYEVGQTWDYTSTFVGAEGWGPWDDYYTAEITAIEPVQVGDQSVDCYRIESMWTGTERTWSGWTEPTLATIEWWPTDQKAIYALRDLFSMQTMGAAEGVDPPPGWTESNAEQEEPTPPIPEAATVVLLSLGLAFAALGLSKRLRGHDGEGTA